MITYLSLRSLTRIITILASKWLYRNRCRSLFGRFAVIESGLIGPYIVCKSMEKVKVNQERLKMAQSRQNTYRDVRTKVVTLFGGRLDVCESLNHEGCN